MRYVTQSKERIQETGVRIQNKKSPPQLNNSWERIFILDECTTAKNTPINESNAFNGAGRGRRERDKAKG